MTTTTREPPMPRVDEPSAELQALVNQMGDIIGPYYGAGDDSTPALAAAYANDRLRSMRWHDENACDCRESVYWRNQTTGRHGYMCVECRGDTQLG